MVSSEISATFLCECEYVWMHLYSRRNMIVFVSDVKSVYALNVSNVPNCTAHSANFDMLYITIIHCFYYYMKGIWNSVTNWYFMKNVLINSCHNIQALYINLPPSRGSWVGGWRYWLCVSERMPQLHHYQHRSQLSSDSTLNKQQYNNAVTGK